MILKDIFRLIGVPPSVTLRHPLRLLDERANRVISQLGEFTLKMREEKLVTKTFRLSEDVVKKLELRYGRKTGLIVRILIDKFLSGEVKISNVRVTSSRTVSF